MTDPATTRTATVLRAAVGEEPLDVDEHARLVEHAAAGAVVTFAGVVRDHDDGKSVHGLEYSAHPTAARIVTEVADAWAPYLTMTEGIRIVAKASSTDVSKLSCCA